MGVKSLWGRFYMERHLSGLVKERTIYFTMDRKHAKEYADQQFAKHGGSSYYSVTVTSAAGMKEALQRFRDFELNLLIVVGEGLIMQGWSFTGNDIKLEFADDFPKEGPLRVQAEGRLRKFPTPENEQGDSKCAWQK